MDKKRIVNPEAIPKLASTVNTGMRPGVSRLKIKIAPISEITNDICSAGFKPSFL